MKIIMILTNAFSPDVRVYKEAKYLVSKGNKVTILCWDKTPKKSLPQYENINGIQIVRFGISAKAGTGVKQLGAYLRFINQCKRYLKDMDFDILHCHDLDGAMVGFLAMGRQYPFIFDMHEYYEKGSVAKRLIVNKLVRMLVNRAKACIYVSQKSFQRYSNKNVGKFYPLRNYSDPLFFRNCKKEKSDRFRIAYIGEVRNQILDFTALFEAVKEMNTVRVDIYGGGIDYDELKRLESQYPNVTIHGRYNGIEESEQIYNKADVSYIAYSVDNPNYQGDFEPVKLYEAIFTCTPIIATSGINPGKIAIEENIGLAVNTRNPKEIHEAIIRLMTDKGFYSECVANMRRISGQYDWNRAVKILDNVYSPSWEEE